MPCGIDSGVWGLAFEKPWKGVTALALRGGGSSGCCAGAPALLATGLRSAWKERGKRSPDTASFKKIMIIILWGSATDLISKRGNNGHYKNSVNK